MKRKPSMRTKHNRAVKKLKHSASMKIYHAGQHTTVTFATDGLVAGDYITINNGDGDSDWGLWTGGSVMTIGGVPKSPKSVHPARKRNQAKKFKQWNTRIEQTSNTTLTIGDSSSVSCTKIDDVTWMVVGDVTI